jgi:hypothetical protein
MQRDGTCSCIEELDQRELANDFAEQLTCELIENMGGVCPAMMDFVVEQVIARFVHVAVFCHDENLEHSERKTLDAVEKYLFKLSRTTPAALKLIMDEQRIKEGPANARN